MIYENANPQDNKLFKPNLSYPKEWAFHPTT